MRVYGRQSDAPLSEVSFAVVLQIAEVQGARIPLALMSCSDPVNLVYEPDLSDHSALRQPADLTFADHVHRFISSDRVQRAAHRSEPEARGDSFFDETVMLFQHIVQVWRWSTETLPSQLARLLQFRNRGGVGWMAVHVSRVAIAGFDATLIARSAWQQPNPDWATT